MRVYNGTEFSNGESTTLIRNIYTDGNGRDLKLSYIPIWVSNVCVRSVTKHSRSDSLLREVWRSRRVGCY